MNQKNDDGFLLKAICLLAPMSLSVQVNIVSQIYVAELVLPCVAIFLLLTKNHSAFDRDFRFLIWLGVAYLASQVVSDIWNETLYQQYARGWSRILLFLTSLISIYVLIDNKRSRLLIFCLGFALGRMWIVLSGLEGDTLPWKIGFAKPVALIVIISSLMVPTSLTFKFYFASLCLLGLGVFDILMDFRSHGSVLIAVALLLITSKFLRAGSKSKRKTRINPAFGLALGLGISAFGAFEFYTYAAQSGWLSERATSKFDQQVENADAPLLVAGRSEVLVYFEAIFDSILIGHGSWPENAYYADKLAEERYDRGLSHRLVAPTEKAIPIHSHIFGSWIEAGIVGGLFWINIILLIAKSLVRSSAGNSYMRPLYLYGALLLLWDVLFSPFSGFRRLETAFLIVIVLRSQLQRQPDLLSWMKRRTRRHRSSSGRERWRSKQRHRHGDARSHARRKSRQRAPQNGMTSGRHS